MSTTPIHTLANVRACICVCMCVYLQALGIPANKAQKILDRSKKAKGPTFIPKGSVKQLVADRPSLPVQWPNMIHRFPLLQNTFAVRLDLYRPANRTNRQVAMFSTCCAQ